MSAGEIIAHRLELIAQSKRNTPSDFHSLGMVLSFGFAAFALMEGIDGYALHYSDAKKSCALTGFCRQCHKFEDVSCGLLSFFIFFGIAGAVVALLPLGAQLHIVSYNTSIFF